MTGMTWYYLSRAAISMAAGGLFVLAGAPWWMAAGIGAVTLAFFIWAPRSGRYSVHPEHGVTALRRDERTQAITDRAARNGFALTMLSLAGLALYFELVASSDVPVSALALVLLVGTVTYFASDLWFGR
jgi:hypothetical protein